MLYRALAGAQTKPATASIKLLIWTKAGSKSDVCLVFFLLLIVHFHCTDRSDLAGIYVSVSLRAAELRISRLCFSFSTESFSKVKPSLFSLPRYQFLFCPAPGCSWFSLMCEGNAAPRGIPPPPGPILNFALSNGPRVPLPLTSHCSPWQLASAPVDVFYHMAQRETDGQTQKRSRGDREGVWVACVGLHLKIEPSSFEFFFLQILCWPAT